MLAKSENASGTVEFSVIDDGGKNVIEGKTTLDSDKWKNSLAAIKFKKNN